MIGCIFSKTLQVEKDIAMNDEVMPNWSERTARTGQAVLAGQGRGFRAAMAFVGPSFVVSIGYIDPGNFVTNIEAGSQTGLQLLWVVLLANLIAMLFQSLSARVGLATGKSLPALCRENFPVPVVFLMWIFAETAAMATDLAEFLGGAIGLSLLFGLALMPSLILMGLLVYGFLLVYSGFRPLEWAIAGFVAIIGLAYLAELWLFPPDWKEFLLSSITPRLQGANSVTLAVGILGATVMPHVIYLHSGLTAARIPARDLADTRKMIRFSNREVMVALGLAGAINMAMLAMAAATFHMSGAPDIADLETAYKTLLPLAGGAAALLFMIALLASGLASSIVGTLAGQMVMQDFTGRRIPLYVRRLVTMSPAFVVVALGYDPTKALLYSQVVLSLVLPVPILSLIYIARKKDLMGEFRLGSKGTWVALGAGAVVIGLNGLLLLDLAGLV